MSDLMLDVDQAGELKAAFRRGNWTNPEIKCLCGGNTLAEVRKTLLDQGVITPREPALKIKNNTITITVVSKKWDNVEDLIRHLEAKGLEVGDWAKDIMAKPGFVTTEGITLKTGVIKVKEFSDSKRVTKNIRAEAEKRGWLKPPAEAAPLLCEFLSNGDLKEMGLVSLVAGHESIMDSDGYQRLLGVSLGDNGLSLHGNHIGPDDSWRRDCAFLFLLPQE